MDDYTAIDEKEAIRRGELFKSLVEHDGYKLLMTILDTTKESYIEKLIVEKNQEEVVRFQEAIKALDSIKETPKFWISLAERFKEEQAHNKMDNLEENYE